MKKSCFILGALSCITLISVPDSVLAHGWTEYPIARQSKCYNDGGFWSNSIPNKACELAFDKSGHYQFVQRNEVALLIAEPDYRSDEAVKLAIPDGTICAAGSDKKNGLNVPSPDWYKTKIKLNHNGEFEFKFRATAAHRPHFWKFFLTKPDYDHNQSIKWSDLDLVFEAGNQDITKINGQNYFVFNVKLPSDQLGDAVLLTRWQREDPAGEGFYNCSDITLVANDGTPSPDDSNVTSTNPNLDPNSDPNLNPNPGPNSDSSTVIVENVLDDFNFVSHFVKPGANPVTPGENIRIRAFGNDAEEIVDVQLAIDGANVQTWVKIIIDDFNRTMVEAGQSDNWVIGVFDPASGQYIVNEQDPVANKVYSKTDGASFELSHILINEPVPPVVVEQRGSWDREAIYEGNSIVTYDGRTWKAKWWIQNEEPSRGGSGVWKLIADDARGVDSIAPDPDAVADVANVPGSNDLWNPEHIYEANDVIVDNGQKWRAKWWMQGGEAPSSSGTWGAWELIPEIDEATGLPLWAPTVEYYKGDQTVHNNEVWTAQWSIRGQEPGTTGEWGVWRK